MGFFDFLEGKRAASQQAETYATHFSRLAAGIWENSVLAVSTIQKNKAMCQEAREEFVSLFGAKVPQDIDWTRLQSEYVFYFCHMVFRQAVSLFDMETGTEILQHVFDALVPIIEKYGYDNKLSDEDKEAFESWFADKLNERNEEYSRCTFEIGEGRKNIGMAFQMRLIESGIVGLGAWRVAQRLALKGTKEILKHQDLRKIKELVEHSHSG